MGQDDPSGSSSYLSPIPRYEGDSDSSRSASPDPEQPESPSASTFLRTAATLDGLARQLGDLSHSRESSLDDEPTGRCCCGATSSSGSANGTGPRCSTIIERDRMEERMKLSGEIGQALLARYELLENKFRKEVERYEHQLLVKKKALEDSVRRVRNLEKANTQHMQQYAEMSRKQEALEKTLTQQSLTHVRAELQALRENTTRQNISSASGDGLQEQLMDAERRYEGMRDTMEAEKRNARDETRKRKRAEARIAELQEQVKHAGQEVEDIKEARAKDAQDLLANARERLEILHAELSETFRGEMPSETPQYQKALEDLVATNTLLKHDTSELSAMLAESREESRLLREEVEELRSTQRSRSVSPGGPRPLALAAELSQTRNSALHSRTESTPLVGSHADRLGWSRMSTSSSTQAGSWDHQRKHSMALSVTSSVAGDGSHYSPGLGMGQVGEYAGAVQREDGALSPTVPSGRESPRPLFRASPSGGLGYVVNGIPKKSQRPGLQRSYSVDRRRSYFSQGTGTETIVEDPTSMESPANDSEYDQRPHSPASPGSAYFAAAEANRKRRSLVMARRQTMSPHEMSTHSPSGSFGMVHSGSQSNITDFPSPMSESALTSPQKAKRVQRKTLLLLSRSRGVQTDPSDLVADLPSGASRSAHQRTETPPVAPSDVQSETSSIHESVKGSTTITLLVEHLGKILNKLRSADITTLNKRLKKQNLPGDVGHLSRSTMRALQAEVSDLRHHFRGLAGDNTILSRKDIGLLVKLLKEVFVDLVDLQSVVNDVTVDPSLAKKLNKAAYRDEEDAATRAKQGTGLGWIAAPITKFFVTPAAEAEAVSTESPSRTGRTMDRGRLQPGAIKASKQLASTSATTTHVSVEFGGTGIVRRATPAAPATSTVEERLPPSPRDTLNEASIQARQSAGGGESQGAATLRVPGTMKRSKSRANRNELLGIFAGAPRAGAVSPAGGPWQVVSGEPGSGNTANPPGRNKTIRAVSSTHFGDKTIKARSPDQRKRLPMAVDAVIDSSAEQLQGADPSCVDEPMQPALLERQLRPRGLSDSSIRSTYHSHANPGQSLVTTASISTGPAPRQSAYGTTSTYTKPKPQGGGGIFETLSNRLYSFRGGVSNDVSPVNPPKDNPESGLHVSTSSSGSTGSTPALEVPEVKVLPSTPRPIVSPSSSKIPASPTTQASSQTGLFGMLASSMNVSDHDDASDLAASFKRGTMAPRSLSTSRGGRNWE